MELDDLKKSWNALDEHLKNKEFIEEKEIAQLLGRARNKMNSIDRFNRKLRFASIGILTLAVLFLDMRRHTYRPFLLDNPLTVHPGSLLGFVLRPLPEPDPGLMRCLWSQSSPASIGTIDGWFANGS